MRRGVFWLIVLTLVVVFFAFVVAVHIPGMPLVGNYRRVTVPYTQGTYRVEVLWVPYCFYWCNFWFYDRYDSGYYAGNNIVINQTNISSGAGSGGSQAVVTNESVDEQLDSDQAPVVEAPSSSDVNPGDTLNSNQENPGQPPNSNVNSNDTLNSNPEKPGEPPDSNVNPNDTLSQPGNPQPPEVQPPEDNGNPPAEVNEPPSSSDNGNVGAPGDQGGIGSGDTGGDTGDGGGGDDDYVPNMNSQYMSVPGGTLCIHFPSL